MYARYDDVVLCQVLCAKTVSATSREGFIVSVSSRLLQFYPSSHVQSRTELSNAGNTSSGATREKNCIVVIDCGRRRRR